MDSQFLAFSEKHLAGISLKSIQAVIELAGEGATVPFMARYRKERTGNLDEVEIRSVIEQHEVFDEIIKRRTFVLKEVNDQGNLTQELRDLIEKCWNLGELEELYKPYKKKKKTKATLAREAGLEPLANWLWTVGQGELKPEVTMEVKGKDFLNIAAGIINYEMALKGAGDILIEKLANDKSLRDLSFQKIWESGRVVSRRTKDFKPNSKFEMYQEFEEKISSLFERKNSHRYLALRRGWQEEELSVEIKGDHAYLLSKFENAICKIGDSPIGELLKTLGKTSLHVYVLPSVENEVHRRLKETSETESVKVFAENVRRLLLASPYGSKVVLGVDPGLRTGCKVALVDRVGNYVSHTVVQILGEESLENSKKLFAEVFKTLQIEAIAVGNGTAGRQAEIFFRKLVKDLGYDTPVLMVSESGASVYSASDIAREELPSLDVSVRGAVSIARRLQDPLSELVKVDPKSIGVGQYQHDVNQTLLKKNLDAVVESCVNSVGVDLNTASVSLLQFVSGIGPALAKNIVEHRHKNPFQDRSELLKVGRFTPKVYEQSAGFLRINGGRMVLDRTGVHPERYSAVRDMAQEVGLSVADLIGEGAKKLLPLKEKWSGLVGEYTFNDILNELEKPGRDPRDPFKIFKFREDIFEVKDLNEGMMCPGIVSNVTNFGAFVDIGVHQDGLVHISELTDKFVDDPRKVVNPGDQVVVRILKVDKEKNQISLSMKTEASTDQHAYTSTARPDLNGPRGNQRKPQNDSGRRPSNSSSPSPVTPSGYKPRPPGEVNPKLAALKNPTEKTGEKRPQFQARQQHGTGNGGRIGGGSAKTFTPTPKPAFNNPFATLANINKK